MTVRILLEAEHELSEAIGWYGRHRVGLGRAFKREFGNVLARIMARPDVFPRDPSYDGRRSIRRCSFARFPYHVVFDAGDRAVLVIAVAHDQRLPGYWSERLGG